MIGGDKDLCEGVSEAQERGVRVVLVGVEPLDEQNLSPTLAMEADDVLVLSRDFIEPHFKQRDPEVAERLEPKDQHDAAAQGKAFALAWSEKASVEELETVRESVSRSIPAELDRQLLAFGVRALNVGRLEPEPKRELRRGFREAIKELLPPSPPTK